MLKANIHRFNIVEQNPETASALALLLAAAGYEVEAAFESDFGLISVEDTEPEVRLVDLDAPQLSSHELAEQLRAKLDRPVIMPFDDRWEDEPEMFPETQTVHNAVA